MSIRERMSGNEAVAYAMRQIDPDVFAAFPITPSTEIPQYFAQYVADGKVNTEFVTVESEHSSMSACIGAEAAGARAVTATSSCGLAFMYELLYVAASSRLPITLACVNRALTGPININNDHSDSMGIRDAGWIQIYAENNQEAYDNFLQAMPIGEHPSVRLPVMICQDGFITSHALENIVLLDTDSVKAFVGEYRPEHFLLKAENPLAIGPYDLGCHYMEHKVQQAEAMKGAKKRILEVAAQFAALTGREYGLFEAYRMEDAEIALVLIGSSAGTAKVTVDALRARGIPAGLVKIRVFRPFPAEELAQTLKNVKALAILDKAESFSNAGGPLGAEVRGALYDWMSVQAPSTMSMVWVGRDSACRIAPELLYEFRGNGRSSADEQRKCIWKIWEKKQSGQHSICWKTVWQAVRQAMPTAQITGHRT